MISTSPLRARELDMMAEQLDNDLYGHGFAAAALREYANLIMAGIPKYLAGKVEAELPKRRKIENV